MARQIKYGPPGQIWRAWSNMAGPFKYGGPGQIWRVWSNMAGLVKGGVECPHVLLHGGRLPLQALPTLHGTSATRAEKAQGAQKVIGMACTARDGMEKGMPSKSSAAR